MCNIVNRFEKGEETFPAGRIFRGRRRDGLSGFADNAAGWPVPLIWYGNSLKKYVPGAISRRGHIEKLSSQPPNDFCGAFCPQSPLHFPPDTGPPKKFASLLRSADLSGIKAPAVLFGGRAVRNHPAEAWAPLFPMESGLAGGRRQTTASAR